MSKFRTSILIIGLLVIVIAASLLTVLALYITGAVVTDKIELTYAVTDMEKTYDGTPLIPEEYELVSGELLSGHSATVTFTGSQTEAGLSRSSLSVKIYDASGFDVTGEYKIGVKSGFLRVKKRELSVVLNDEEVIYNGSKVSFDDYTVTEGELVSGHKIVGAQTAQLINVSDELPDGLEVVVVDPVGNDVTKNYLVDFSYNKNRISIVKRPITVKPVDKIKVYDGVEVNLNEIEILSGSLAEGQFFKAVEVISDGDGRPLNVCDMTTRIVTLKIYQSVGSEDVEVTANYEIDSSETGVVRIEKRPLRIVARSGSWEYDGADHGFTSESTPLSCEGLAPGEELTSVVYSGSQRTAGSTENTIVEVRLYNSALNTSAPTSNYEMTLVDGTITVNKREVTIITPTVTKAYDGEPLWGASTENKPLGLNLAPNHMISYDAGSLPQQTEVGTKSNNIECKIIDINEPDTDLAENYKITLSPGTITVNKRTARVSTRSESKTFDGETLYGFDTEEDVDTYNILPGHILNLPEKDEIQITDVGRKYNRFSVTIVNGEGKDVTNNYDIDYQYGYLEITKLYITVKTSGETKIFDGVALQLSEESTDIDGLPKGGGISAVLADGQEYPSLDGVGRQQNKVLYKLVYGGSDVDEDNYSIDYQYGYLEVTRLNVSVKTGGETKIFDGVALKLGEEFTVIDGLSKDGGISAVLADGQEYPSLDGVGREQNRVLYKLVYNGEDVDGGNYNIDYTYGYLEITRLNVSIKTGGDTKVFDGVDLQLDEEFTVIDGLSKDGGISAVLADGQEYPSINGVGRQQNKVLYKLVYEGGDVDAGNYSIEYQYGYLEITRLNITVKTGSETKEYDGGTLQLDEDSTVIEGLPEDGGISAVLTYGQYYPSINKVEKRENKVLYKLVYGGSDVATGNYNIEYQYGYIEYTTCELYLNLKNVNQFYSPDEFDLSVEDALEGSNLKFLSAANFQLKAPAGVLNAGSYSYTVELTGYELSNFDLRISGGSITIAKCAVDVQLMDYTEAAALIYNGEVQTLIAENSITLSQIDDESDISHLNAGMFRIVPSGTIKNVGTYTYTVRFINSNNDRNHELYISGGEVTVNQLEITINLPQGKEVEYTGKSLIPTTEVIDEADLEGTVLTKGDFKIVAIDGDAINVSDEAYRYTAQIVDSREAENYKILGNEGSVVVTKAKITITLTSAQKTYSGKSHLPKITDAISDVSDLKHLSKNAFEIIADDEMKNAGTYTYTVAFRNLSDDYNHEIEFTNENGVGTVQIDKCSVNVQLKNFDEQKYTATEKKLALNDVIAAIDCDGELITAGGNASRYFEIYSSDVIKDVGTYEYSIRFIYREDSDNFELTVNGSESGVAEYVIVPLEVELISRIAADSQRKTYDGKVFTVNIDSVIASGALYLQTADADKSTFDTFFDSFTATCQGTDSSWGIQDLSFTNVRVFNINGENITRNLKITNNASVRVEITQRDLTITLDDYFYTGEMPRTGNPNLVKSLGISSTTPLLSGYSASFRDAVIQVQTATGTLRFDDFGAIVIYDEGGNVVTDNFYITNMNEGYLSSSLIQVG